MSVDVVVHAVATWTAERGAPRAELIPVAQRRRCSLATRIVAEVTAELCAAGAPIDRAAIVCGTGFGEIATTAELLAMMQHGDGASSPLRFAGSVHNTAIGQLAIALGHRGQSTTVSAGAHTVTAAWLEAMGLLAHGAEHVVVVLADEPMPAPLQPRHDGLAVGLWLSARATAPMLARVRWLGAVRDAPPAMRVPAAVQHNPVRFAWSLAEALRGDGEPQLRLEPDDARGLASTVQIERCVGTELR